MEVESKELLTWVRNAKLSNLRFHRTRTELFESLVGLIKIGFKSQPAVIDNQQWHSVKGLLCSRNEDLSEAKLLAFETVLDRLQSDLQSSAVGVSSHEHALAAELHSTPSTLTGS